MTVSADEFLRRFCLHVLPKGFVRIRFYGFLAHRCRTEALPRCRRALGANPPPVPVASVDRPVPPCVVAAVSCLRWGDGPHRTTDRTPLAVQVWIEGLALDTSERCRTVDALEPLHPPISRRVPAIPRTDKDASIIAPHTVRLCDLAARQQHPGTGNRNTSAPSHRPSSIQPP